MKLELRRTVYTDKSTIGELYVDGLFECYTLEDVVRNKKIYGETAIPAGSYHVKITQSPRFKRELPLLLNVPGFEGVRIHPGNSAQDTEGCILVGLDKGADFIGRSRQAFDALFAEMKQADEITLTIVG